MSFHQPYIARVAHGQKRGVIGGFKNLCVWAPEVWSFGFWSLGFRLEEYISTKAS